MAAQSKNFRMPQVFKSRVQTTIEADKHNFGASPRNRSIISSPGEVSMLKPNFSNAIKYER